MKGLIEEKFSIFQVNFAKFEDVWANFWNLKSSFSQILKEY